MSPKELKKLLEMACNGSMYIYSLIELLSCEKFNDSYFIDTDGNHILASKIDNSDMFPICELPEELKIN